MHPNDGRVISNFIVQAFKQEPITIFGDGGQTRSFCYVEDMIRALVGFMGTDAALTGPINLGGPQEATILEIAELVLRLTGSGSEIAFEPLPDDDPKQRCPDITLAKRHLGWSPQVSLEDGIKETVAYFGRRLGL